MKKIIPFTIAAALAASGLANAQAFSKPSGYVTTTVAGNASGNPSGAATFVSPALIEAVTFSGISSSSPSGAKTISFAAPLSISLDGSYLLEITSGPQEGWWTTVTSSGANNITVFDDFPAGLVGGVNVNVRKFTTLKSWLGDNTPGLSPVVDRVDILNPMTQVVLSYSYATTDQGAPENGWYELSGPTLANDAIIYPGTAVKFIRFASTPLAVVGTGVVKLTKTQVDIYPKDNWIDTGLAVGRNLGGLDLKGQLIEFTSPDSGHDQLIKIFPDQSAVPFAVIADGVAPFSIANLAESTDAASEPFDSATGANLRRSPTGAQSIITFPAQTIGSQN